MDPLYTCDFFFGATHSIIQIHGFRDESFILPKTLKEWVVALEITRKLELLNVEFNNG